MVAIFHCPIVTIDMSETTLADIRRHATSNNNTLILQLSGEVLTVEQSVQNSHVADLQQILPENQPRYLVHTLADGDALQHVFIYYCPDSCDVGSKMRSAMYKGFTARLIENRCSMPLAGRLEVSSAAEITVESLQGAIDADPAHQANVQAYRDAEVPEWQLANPTARLIPSSAQQGR